MRLMLLAMTVLLGPLTCCNALSAPGDAPPEPVFLGYVAGMPREINYSLYTHLAHAFLDTADDGSVRLNDRVPSRELTTAAHQAGVKVLISLGGGGSEEPFVAMSVDRAAEGRFVREVLQVVDEFDYDGIDFDWEYPDTKTELVCFARMTRRFRQMLDELGEKKERNMLLTMAVNCHPDRLQWLSNELLLENMDWINLMTYDFTGPWTHFAGHQSPLFLSSQVTEKPGFSTESAINTLIEGRNYPADRLALGIPLYGRMFAVDTPYASTVNAPRPRKEALTYHEIFDLGQQANWQHTWDDETKSPWLIARDRAEVICYDDPQSVALKTAWAKQHGLRGVFFWQIAGDRLADGSNPLQAAAHETLFPHQPQQ